MASLRQMSNGGNKPGYISSFMSFLESQDDDPDDPTSLSELPSASGEEIQVKKEVEEEPEMSFDLPEEGEIIDKEIKVEVGEEVTSTDYIPTEIHNTDEENTNSSEATSMSESGDSSKPGRRNVARRGRRKTGAAKSSGTEPKSQRESLRRTSRAVKRYGNFDTDSDGLPDSDVDFHLSDSDDDPDFNPVDKKTSAASDEEEVRPRRGRGRGRGSTTQRGIFTPQGRGRGIKRSLEKDNVASASKSSHATTNSPPKRRGRPPTYVKIIPPVGDSGTENSEQSLSTNDSRGSTQLSSAYNYAGSQAQRQNQPIMIEEGPQLTEEQLEMGGEFVMSKRDKETMENPPIWRIDGKSLLQKFQAFEKDGKILYRNISTYSGWTSQAKALYLRVKVTFVFQSRYDTVVQMLGFKAEGEDDDDDDNDDEENEGSSKKDDSTNNQTWASMKGQQADFEISEELLSHMKTFEIYLQTLISQALDNNFLVEIYEENDEYFVERVKMIDELAEQRKNKILEIVEWRDPFKQSLDTWPCCNVMVQTPKTVEDCKACSKNPSAKLFQLFGQPYNKQNLHYTERRSTEAEKNFNVCDSCSNIAQLYNKVSHQKFDYYSQCKSKVTNMRAADSAKATTTILQELISNNAWITKLFRSMCTTWIKVDKLHEDEVERSKKEVTTT